MVLSVLLEFNLAHRKAFIGVDTIFTVDEAYGLKK